MENSNMKTVIIIEKGADGTYSVYPDNLETVIVGEGNTVEEAKADFMNSYTEILEYYKDTGKDIPESLYDAEFEFKYDVSSLFNEFYFINVSKFAEWIGISPSLMRHYKSGDTYISDSQAKKIEDGLHRIAARLMSVTL